MGSLRQSLSLPEHLRQWREAGLRVVLGDAPGAMASEVSPTAEAAPALVAQATPPSPPAPAPASQEVGPWPEPWAGYRTRVVTPCRLVWTYWELAADMATPHDVRRQLWRRMLGALGWPQGRVAFWPLCEVADEATVARAELFWRGVREFQAPTVACFGRRAFMTLFPERSFRPGRLRTQGLTVLALPSPEELLAGDIAAKRLAWEALKGLDMA